MGQVKLTADVTQVFGFSKAMIEGPKVMGAELAKAFTSIGKYDIDAIRNNLSGTFNIRAKGLRGSFKYKVTKPANPAEFGKLSVSEYTGWKAAEIFQEGGVVSGHGKSLTILEPAALTASGRRKYTQQQLRNMIASGQARFVPTPRGTLIVMDQNTELTKKGKPRRGAKSIVLAIIKRSITQKKRLNFIETAEANDGVHQDMLETAVENALVTIATTK